ncbi:HAD-IIB family hydrolase [Candidatus Woesearchaeota archaeon]|nr:HAD-IIB family hydrolase [Candidatus Woesearchaeota archaeon]
MDVSQKKIIIADVDETICETCQQITPEMAKQISSMITKGYTWAFISGTEPHYLKEMISAKLTEPHFLLPTTGTICLDAKNNLFKEEYSYYLTPREKKEAIDAFEELVTKYHIKTLTTKEDQIQNRGTQITLSAIGRNAPTNFKKIYDPDATKRKEWIKFLKTILDENKYEITYAGTTSIDVTRKGLDKAWGIKKFAQHYNIPLNQILFFGDKTHPGGNDYPATKIVDFITVKNPEDTLNKLKEYF